MLFVYSKSLTYEMKRFYKFKHAIGKSLQLCLKYFK